MHGPEQAFANIWRRNTARHSEAALTVPAREAIGFYLTMERYSRHGPTVSRYWPARVRTICAMWPRS